MAQNYQYVALVEIFSRRSFLSGCASNSSQYIVRIPYCYWNIQRMWMGKNLWFLCKTSKFLRSCTCSLMLLYVTCVCMNEPNKNVYSTSYRWFIHKISDEKNVMKQIGCYCEITSQKHSLRISYNIVDHIVETQQPEFHFEGVQNL